MIALEPLHTLAAPAMAAVGAALTVIALVAVLLHPAALVTVTV